MHDLGEVVKRLEQQRERLINEERRLAKNGVVRVSRDDEADLLKGLADAITLLKEKEQRILSFADAMLDPDRDVVWIEAKGDPYVEPVIPVFAVNEYADVVCESTAEDGKTVRYPATNCGVTWRLWSSRPTPEQMEATPWET